MSAETRVCSRTCDVQTHAPPIEFELLWKTEKPPYAAMTKAAAPSRTCGRRIAPECSEGIMGRHVALANDCLRNPPQQVEQVDGDEDNNKRIRSVTLFMRLGLPHTLLMRLAHPRSPVGIGRDIRGAQSHAKLKGPIGHFTSLLQGGLGAGGT